jgi:hypothetical protein
MVVRLTGKKGKEKIELHKGRKPVKGKNRRQRKMKTRTTCNRHGHLGEVNVQWRSKTTCLNGGIEEEEKNIMERRERHIL